MRRIYADNAATTRLSQVAKEAMLPYLDQIYGNPSSLHSFGQEAAQALSQSRDTIARLIGASPSELTFTSGGSEADNQAIRSAAYNGAAKQKRHLITSRFEHHAVLHTFQQLEKEGFEVTWLEVYEDGLVRVEDLRNAIRTDTALVSVMYANNEIGTVQPIRELGAVCRERGVVFHTDAVQAVGHIPVDVQADNIDLLALSAHKFHGPKGIGVLYCRKGVPLRTLIQGGAQERGKRAGTENLPAIVGMAAALEEACGEMDANIAHLSALRDQLIQGLTRIPQTLLNGHPARRLPGTVNLCFKGIEGESLLLLLDQAGIAASSGSACTSGSLDPSHVLLALGLSHEVAHGSLRLSLSPDNTAEDVAYIVETVPKVVDRLRDMSPVWEQMQKEAM